MKDFFNKALLKTAVGTVLGMVLFSLVKGPVSKLIGRQVG
jgi:hypothetical protein